MDPRFTRVVARADIWLQPRPGADTALALGMANVIVKEELYDKQFVEQYVHGWEESNINVLMDSAYETCDPAIGATNVRTLLCKVYPENGMGGAA